MSKSVTVTELPPCDLCADGVAAYDFKTSLGPWGYGCKTCFVKYGGRLGTGYGQKLVLPDVQRDAAAELLLEGLAS